MTTSRAAKLLGLSSLSIAILLGLAACSKPTSEPVIAANDNPAVTTTQFDNVLLQPFTGPYEGVPAFDQMDLTLLTSAVEQGMALQLAEIDAITANPAPATFANTFVPLEQAVEALGTAFTYYGIWRSNMSSPEFREIQRALSPKLSEFNSKISQNEALFARIKTVYESAEFATLTLEEQRIVESAYKRFIRGGILLDDAGKQRTAEINKRLAELQTQFSSNVLNDEENIVTFLSKDQLAGLSQGYITAAKAAAEERGQPQMYAVTNTRSSMDPFLTYSTERELRREVWEKYYSRGNNGDAFDNNAIIQEILTLRHERVKLLGFDDYATWRLEDRMAKTPQNAMALMDKVWPAAIARVAEEVADMQAIADTEGANITIAPWDYRFYAEKVRKATYDLNSDEVKQYLQLDKLRDAMFYVAERLFNFSFVAVPDGKVPVWHPDVKVWEVNDATTGRNIGLWYLDPFARQGKRSGAWATYYREYTTFNGETNVLSANNSNFVKAPEEQPTLISWDDAETYFHEFGHALHFLAADVVYPSSHSGVRDYTEFQSQLLERWLLTDEVISQFLVHHETGEPMPEALVQKIKNAATFNEGFKTTEYMASAIMDLKYHTTDPALITDVQTFERDTLSAIGMPAQIPMRHRSTHFQHIFSSEGYAAAYYGYMWAEVLTSDAAEAFAQAPGGYYDEALADKMVQFLFAPRNAMDPADAYRQFRGRDAKVDALMRDRGFPVPNTED
jgi:peptidyl-dipeptidase Dcp